MIVVNILFSNGHYFILESLFATVLFGTQTLMLQANLRTPYKVFLSMVVIKVVISLVDNTFFLELTRSWPVQSDNYITSLLPLKIKEEWEVGDSQHRVQRVLCALFAECCWNRFSKLKLMQIFLL